MRVLDVVRSFEIVEEDGRISVWENGRFFERMPIFRSPTGRLVAMSWARGVIDGIVNERRRLDAIAAGIEEDRSKP
jgi:hypothetical protein